MAEAFGVWVEKSMYGKKYMGNERTTFVIDPDGRVAHVLRKVKPDAHDEQVLRRSRRRDLPPSSASSPGCSPPPRRPPRPATA